MVDELAQREVIIRGLEDNGYKKDAKLDEVEKLLRRRMQAEAECRQMLDDVKVAKRNAEAKLAACEEELTALKALHRDVAFRVRLDWAMQALAAKPPGHFLMPSVDVAPALLAWTDATKLHRVVAEAIQRSAPKTFIGELDTSNETTMAFLKELKSKQDVAELVCSPSLLEGLVDVVWHEVQALQR